MEIIKRQTNRKALNKRKNIVEYKSLHTTQCIFNGEVWELKPKFWDLFSNFTTEKRRLSLLWSPLKYTRTVTYNLTYLKW